MLLLKFLLYVVIYAGILIYDVILYYYRLILGQNFGDASLIGFITSAFWLDIGTATVVAILIQVMVRLTKRYWKKILKA